MESTTQIPESSRPDLLAVIAEALRGSHRDYTEGEIGSAILMLSIPMVLEMIMESVFAVADIYFAGKLGPDAVATIGLTESLIMIVYTIAVGLSIGATAFVARRIGEQNPKGAAHVAAQSLWLGGLISIGIAVIGIPLSEKFLLLLGASPELAAYGKSYTQVMLGGNIVVLLLFLANAILRGAGDAQVPMRALWLANGLNIALAPCLIFGYGPFPELGVMGAAVATTTARGAGAIYSIAHLFRKNGRIVITRSELGFDGPVMKKILELSANGTFQTFVGMVSWIGLVRVISGFGADAVAGYTIGIRIVLFALFPSFGLSNAAATLVGQALGAKKPERAEQAVWRTCYYNAWFLGVISLIFIFFPRPIVGCFTTDAEVLAIGVDCLRTIAFGFVFYAYGIVLTQSFNGAGDTRTPTLLNFLVFWLFEIPAAYVLAVPLGMGPFGAFLAITIAFSVLAVPSAILFKRGHWKLKSI